MATLALQDLRAQIADDLARDDLTSQILTAIRTAIRSYETERFGFNEITDQTVTLSTSVASLAMIALPQTFLQIDRIKLLQSGSASNYIQLEHQTADYVKSQRDVAVTSTPSCFAIYGNALQFDSMYSSDQTILIDGIIKVSSASRSSDSAQWFNDGVDLIRSAAKKDIYLHIIQDINMATAMNTAEKLAYAMLKGKGNRLKSTGVIVPTSF